MGGSWGHMDWWGMAWGWLFLAILVVGAVLLVVVLIRILSRRDHRRDHPQSGRSRARDVLDERYARGEIDAAEYDERRQRLDGDT